MSRLPGWQPASARAFKAPARPANGAPALGAKTADDPFSLLADCILITLRAVNKLTPSMEGQHALELVARKLDLLAELLAQEEE